MGGSRESHHGGGEMNKEEGGERKRNADDGERGDQSKRKKEMKINISLLFYKIMISYDGHMILFY